VYSSPSSTAGIQVAFDLVLEHATLSHQPRLDGPAGWRRLTLIPLNTIGVPRCKSAGRSAAFFRKIEITISSASDPDSLYIDGSVITTDKIGSRRQ
jgi:hypothetical protein